MKQRLTKNKNKKGLVIAMQGNGPFNESVELDFAKCS